MKIANDMANIAIMHAIARPICKNSKKNPIQRFLLEALAYIPFIESLILQIQLKLGW